MQWHESHEGQKGYARRMWAVTALIRHSSDTVCLKLTTWLSSTRSAGAGGDPWPSRRWISP